jgi:Fe-S oxidoreductase
MFIREEYGLPATHVLSLLCERLDGVAKKLDLEVTYHDPCHFSRGAGIIREPREVLRAIGVQVKEMEFIGDQSRCCGGGGGLLVSDVPLSDAIAKDRVFQAASTGAKTIVTPCATCETTLKKTAMALAKEGQVDMQVKNLWDLVFAAVR